MKQEEGVNAPDVILKATTNSRRRLGVPQAHWMIYPPPFHYVYISLSEVPPGVFLHPPHARRALVLIIRKPYLATYSPLMSDNLATDSEPFKEALRGTPCGQSTGSWCDEFLFIFWDDACFSSKCLGRKHFKAEDRLGFILLLSSYGY
ncbi:hypothetical protein CEXT_686451 [Caerostris extrusa]|uniref:Uncharacterized protein n=1 Tax=Caerostris extrusa TaxID=172846 RepID=A0AAV4RP22_CAEEX|nr:hypothetical protein CEXT_686451 [Caerostris extrusa]